MMADMQCKRCTCLLVSQLLKPRSPHVPDRVPVGGEMSCRFSSLESETQNIIVWECYKEKNRILRILESGVSKTSVVIIS